MWCLAAWIRALQRLRIDNTSRLTSNKLMLFHMSWTARHSSSLFLGLCCLFCRLVSIWAQRFSMGFMSGLLAGQGPNTWTLLARSQSLVTNARWAGALSCMNCICGICLFMKGKRPRPRASFWYLMAVTFPLNLMISLFPPALFASPLCSASEYFGTESVHFVYKIIEFSHLF